jgi:hypothetical protein
MEGGREALAGREILAGAELLVGREDFGLGGRKALV